MTTAFRLGLPTDIPWTRLCVTEDMIDRVVCDSGLPPKWQSSIAVFRYVPDKEYQLFPDYDISYLRVTATITGYQALDDEIQGQIDWNGVDVSTLDGLTELLNSYFPCNGAIVQVVVGPAGRDPDVDPERYPFFLDFEPKKRELYETATDTNERQSRSSETLQIGKSAGTAQSLEVLDVDMGGSASLGMESTYAGTGGGFNIAGSSSGQWGTKRLNTQQSQLTRVAEAGQERRESYSFTTQLSQMYALLDSYHLGTNRAVFFVQPRPHVLEEPSGFVRGPRKVEGIQEFFLVVAQRKGAGDYCVSVRLDTGHLVETDVLDYEVRTEVSDLASATAPTPTRADTPDGTVEGRVCLIHCFPVTYDCFRTDAVDDVVYTAPAGFLITGFEDLINETDNGSSMVTIAPGNRTLTIHAQASGRTCVEDNDLCGHLTNCPHELVKRPGSARRQVQVNLRSEEPTVKVDVQKYLVVTTRALCCCKTAGPPHRPTVTGVWDIPVEYADVGVPYQGRELLPSPSGTGARSSGAVAPLDSTSPLPLAAAGRLAAAAPGRGPSAGCAPQAAVREVGGRMPIRQANAMIDYIRQRMITTARDPRAPQASFLETDLFARQLHNVARRSRLGRELLGRPLGAALPKYVAAWVAKRTGKRPAELTARDLLRFSSGELVRATGVSPAEAGQLKLRALGVPIRANKPGARRRRRGRPAD